MGLLPLQVNVGVSMLESLIILRIWDRLNAGEFVAPPRGDFFSLFALITRHPQLS